MTEENKVTLLRKRAELVEKLATSLAPENRVRIQGELSLINAKIKALNTTSAAQLKAEADRRKIAGLTEAQANAARARAKLGSVPEDEEDDDPGQTVAIDAWIADVLARGGIKVHRAPSDGKRGIEVPASVPKKFTAVLHALCNGIHAVARGEELPLLWNGLCPAGKHGLDFEDQSCDLCAAEVATAKASPKARKRS
jgi:hypothetical protein